jgi:hypothetical protein
MAKKQRALDLFKGVIPAIDRKDYSYYDSLSEEQLKEFSSVLIMRWGVNVDDTDPELLHYYLASINHHANKNFFNVYKHPKLQWLMIVAGSPKFGNYRRKWIGKKKEKNKYADVKRQLLEIYPTYKEEDIDLLSTFVTKKELVQFNKDNGN